MGLRRSLKVRTPTRPRSPAGARTRRGALVIARRCLRSRIPRHRRKRRHQRGGVKGDDRRQRATVWRQGRRTAQRLPARAAAPSAGGGAPRQHGLPAGRGLLLSDAIRLSSHVNLRGDGMSVSWLRGISISVRARTISWSQDRRTQGQRGGESGGANHTASWSPFPRRRRHRQRHGRGHAGQQLGLVTQSQPRDVQPLQDRTQPRRRGFLGQRRQRRRFNDISVYENPAAGGSR